jgi:RHS repeat-associated protein
VGNRGSVNTDSVVTSYATNNMNEYDAVGGVANLQDNDGNLKDDGTHTFVHDALNRLIEVRRISDGLTVARYTYDALNRRVTKTVTNSGALNGATRYLLDGVQEIEERDGADAVVAQYVYGPAIDEILTMERGGQAYYYHDDSLGSIEALTDGTQAIVERTTYDAYGAPKFTNATFTPAGTTSSVGNPFLFTAQRLDPETGLYYYRNRYYNPSTGRFIERDPTGYGAGSMGLYEYPGNNPIDSTDPMGLFNQSSGAGRRGGSPTPSAPAQRGKSPTPSAPAQTCCGPDVTKELAAVLKKIKNTFAGWTPTQQKDACSGLTKIIPGKGESWKDDWFHFMNAWDIKDLSKRGWGAGWADWMNKPPYSPPCAMPPCQDTVEVDGQCFYEGSVNYAAFGVMWKLCNRWKWTMRLSIYAYKGPNIGLRPAATNWIPSREWAVAGYKGWVPDTGTTPPGDNPQCSHCPVAYAGPQFTVHWYPMMPDF